MKVSEIMSSKVITIKPDSTLRELWKLIFIKNLNALPVVDKSDKLVGIVTKDDMLTSLYPDYKEYISDISGASDFEKLEDRLPDAFKKPVRNLMNKRVIFTRGETQVMRALSRMIVRHVNQLPVLNSEYQVIGIVTKSDIFKALFRLQDQKHKSPPRKPSK